MGREEVSVFYIRLSGPTWLGGNHYFDNLTANAKRFHPEMHFIAIDSFEIPLFFPDLTSRIKHFYQRRFKKEISAGLKRQGRISFLNHQKKTEKTCIYTVSVDHLRGTENFPRIYWIPDFQVYHLPHFFVEKDIQFRKRSYQSGSEMADLVVLSSNAALNDFKNFFPSQAHKGRVLNFVVDVPEELFSSNPASVLSTYQLPEKFFYMPNQFWQHKNHQLLLDAMRILKSAGHNLHVVLSGTMEDRRNPEHVSSLLNFIREHELENSIRVLGVIPKEDVLLLMRQCCAMINPSRFEGWSTTVEESKSLGKRMLLSSIDVHFEQDPPGARFFGCDDVNALAQLLWETWNVTHEGPDLAMEAFARDSLTARKKKFADDFFALVDEAISIHSKKTK